MKKHHKYSLEMGEAKKLRGNLHQPHAAAAANASIPTRYSTYVRFNIILWYLLEF